MESSTGAQAPNQHRTDIIAHISKQPAPYVRAGDIAIEFNTDNNVMVVQLKDWVFTWSDGTTIQCGCDQDLWYKHIQENALENIPYIAGYSPNELFSLALGDARLSRQIIKAVLDEYEEADLGCNLQKIDAHDYSENPCIELVGLKSVSITNKLDDGPTSSAVQKPKPRFGWHG